MAMHKTSTFPCNYCPMTFNKKFLLQHHTQSHSGPKKFNCNVCSASYNDKSNLFKHHKLKHNPNREEIICKLCKTTFSCSRNLQYHMNQHNNITPYQCTKCELSFTSPVFRAKHNRKHH